MLKDRLLLYFLACGCLTASVAVAAAANCSTYPDDAPAQMTNDEMLSALGPAPKPSGRLHFVYVAKTLYGYSQAIAQGMKDESKALGVVTGIQAPQDESSAIQQLNMAQSVLQQKPDAILMSPQSDTNLVPTIQGARKANIPTVLVIDAKTAGVSTFIGTDQIAMGNKAAEYIHKLHPDGGEVAQIEGQAGSPNARKRIQGFKEGVAKYPNLKLVASQPGNWDRLTALNATTNILRAHPDLIGVYANNDDMALGVVQAAKNAGKLKQVTIVGTDGISAAKQSISNGELAATVADDLYDEGKISVDLAVRLLACQKVPKWVVTSQALITRENVAQFPNAPAYKP